MIEERKSRRGGPRPGSGRPRGARTPDAAIGASVRALESAASALAHAAKLTGDEAYRATAETVAGLAGQVRARAILGQAGKGATASAAAVSAPSGL
jgi:hypothetical protein